MSGELFGESSAPCVKAAVASIAPDIVSATASGLNAILQHSSA